MEMTEKDLMRISHYSDVFRNNCERKIRKIKRNMAMLNKEYESLPAEVIEDCGFVSPAQEISDLVEQKAEAVIIKKKVQFLVKKLKAQKP